MKFFNWLPVCILVFSLSSCIGYRYVDIQVLNPSPTKLPPEINLHVIEPLKPDSNYIVFKLRQNAANKPYLFNMFIHNFDSTFKQHFEESPVNIKSKVVIQDETAFRSELKRKSISELKKNTQLIFRELTLIEKEPILAFNEEDYSFYSQKSFCYDIMIELVNIATDQIYDSYLFQDTITWTSHNYYKELASRDLPTMIEAMADVGKLAAEKYSNRNAPCWVTEERFLYYSNNKYMREGYKKFIADDLDGAIASWRRLYEIGTKQLASAAAHNIALAYEFQDDLENSETWLNNSLSLRSNLDTKLYLTKILERKAKRKELETK